MSIIAQKPLGDRPTAALPSIQAFRAIAALSVLFCHLKLFLNIFGYIPNPLPLFDIGGAGVDLFFVISGFIMVYASERLFGQRHASRRFLARRFIRIFPLYWALTTIAIFGWHIGALPPHLTWTNVVGSYLLIPTTRPSGGTAPELVQAWTLYYEMFFYVLFAAAIVLPQRLAVATLTVLFVAILAAAHLLGPLAVPWGIWVNPIILEFVFGMWVALAFRAGWRIQPVICCAVAVAAFAFMFVAQQYNLVDEQPMTGGYSRLIWGAGAALIIASAVLADTSRPAPAVLTPLVVMGDASYALYLFQTFVPFGLYAVHAPRLLDPAVYPFWYSVVTAALAIVGALVINIFDAEFRRWILNRARLRPRVDAGVPRGYAGLSLTQKTIR